MHKRAECITATDEQVVEDDPGLEVREVEVTVIGYEKGLNWYLLILQTTIKK